MNRAVGVALVVAVCAGLGATAYWNKRAENIRIGESADSLAESLGASGSFDAPAVGWFWLLVGVSTVAALVAIAVSVAAYVAGPLERPLPPGRK